MREPLHGKEPECDECWALTRIYKLKDPPKCPVHRGDAEAAPETLTQKFRRGGKIGGALVRERRKAQGVVLKDPTRPPGPDPKPAFRRGPDRNVVRPGNKKAAAGG